jgi:hypothetical protein
VIRQLADRLRALHQFVFPEDLAPTVSPQLLGGDDAFAPTEPLLAALARARELEHVDPTVISSAERIVRESAFALDPWACETTIHGDLHFENVLWDGTRITALLDFEYSRPGPPDLDLDVFLRFCAYPFLHVAEDYEDLTLAEDYVDVPYWLAQDYPELFGHPHQFERLRLYCIAYDVRELLLFPPQRRPRDLSEHHPINRLSRTVRAEGHLDALHRNARLTAG